MFLTIATFKKKEEHNIEVKIETSEIATKQSFGFFTDIRDSDWDLLRRISSSRKKHVIPGDENTFYIAEEKSKHKVEKFQMLGFSLIMSLILAACSRNV